jgi:hypothetical protein
MAAFGHLSHEFTQQFTELCNYLLYLWRVKSRGWLNKQLQILPITERGGGKKKIK